MRISGWSSDVCSSDLTSLRQTHVQRHLSAFKAVDADAGTRLGALLSATSSLALARADAPADTHAALASACIISEFVEFHVLALAFAMFAPSPFHASGTTLDRKSVVLGKSGLVRVEL